MSHYQIINLIEYEKKSLAVVDEIVILGVRETHCLRETQVAKLRRIRSVKWSWWKITN